MDPSFAPLRAELEHVADLPVPWYVAGGWAIDLFVGQVTRDHQDVDLVIGRRVGGRASLAGPARVGLRRKIQDARVMGFGLESCVL